MPAISLYRRHRFPAEIINHCVWLYFRFALSFRDVEEIMAMRGVTLTYETIREWCLKFGQTYANQLRRRRPRPGDKWLLDEVFIKINGRVQYLWRAVDQDGNVLDILVQSRRNKKAAKRFFRKLLKELQYVPRVLITDKLKSYGAAKASDHAGSRASPAQRAEQPRRELTPADQSTRESDEEVQVSRTCTTLPLRLFNHRIALQTKKASADGWVLPSRDEAEIRGVG